MTKPTLYMTIGLPGSGKTEWAKSTGHKVFSSDAIREELGDVNDQNQNNKVFEILHKRVKDALCAGESCVYDATNVASKRRRAFLNEIRRFDCIKTAVMFIVDPDILRERNKSRERQVPGEVISRMLHRLQPPVDSEGWDSICSFIVRGSADPLQLYSDMDQANSHHSLTLMEHSELAEKLALKKARSAGLSSSRTHCLQTAAYYHDVGKYWTRTFKDSRGYPTMEAHYYNHENVGAYMYLLAGDEASIDHDLYTSALIAWHMRPYVWDKEPQVKENDRKWMKPWFIEDLEILHEADMEAH